MIEEFINKIWDEKNNLWYDIYKRDDEDLYTYKLIPNQKILEEQKKLNGTKI